ncbi:MAG TPA: ThiF family adenylyltransferase [Gemmatimonadales bacterium]|nr:ThiF family adenylyltransferase [Gemmatimonadales bacterium]
MAEQIDNELRAHLIREDGQEDLAFALWSPSVGAERLTALLHAVVLPKEGDRQVHGNVSFNQQYFERVCQLALAQGLGIAFLHSHPYPGWQDMSWDDVVAERRIAGPAAALTGLPLVGLTVGSNGAWSARFWVHEDGRSYGRHWCALVRVVGGRLRVTYADEVLPRPAFRDLFRRTVTVWGPEAHADLARLRVGIVGLGSVGALVAETLARMGLTRFALIDFDHVEPHNLDRLVTATERDIGRLKVDVAQERMNAIATAEAVDVRGVPFSVVEEAGYRAALDCDVIFCCVDRPRARHVLNHMAYGHLIPVIDGGIAVRFKDRRFSGVDWQVQTVAAGRPCLECLETYDQADVSTEAAGMLDDLSYLKGLPSDHRFKRNENVFPFSANLASLEVLHLVALVTGAAGVTDFGVQRYRYLPGILEQLPATACKPHCDQDELVGQGDRHFILIGRDLAAERSRTESTDKESQGQAEVLPAE